MPVFPSIEWFDTVRTAANDNPETITPNSER